MSGGTLPRTGAGLVSVGGITVTTLDLALYGLVAVAVGVVLVALSVRWGWRRNKAPNRA
jgi:hypothetical protein